MQSNVCSMTDGQTEKKRRLRGSRSYGDLLCLDFILLLLVVCFFGQVKACTDEEVGPSTIQMVLRSELLLYGKILKTYADERYDHGVVYTAEMKVFCIIKGPVTNRIVNISLAGAIPGNCYTTTLEFNHTYVVVAEFNGTHYRPVDTEISSGKMDDVSKACRLEPKYPSGVTGRVDFPEGERCPTPALTGKCIDEAHFTTTTTTTTTTELYDVIYPICDDPTLCPDVDSYYTSTSAGTKPASDRLLVQVAPFLLVLIGERLCSAPFFLPSLIGGGGTH